MPFGTRTTVGDVIKEDRHDEENIVGPLRPLEIGAPGVGRLVAAPQDGGEGGLMDNATAASS